MCRRLIVVVSIFLLSACSTTPQAMRQDAPIVVHTSNKDPKAIAICIANKWENTRVLGGGLDVDFRPTENGYTVMQQLSGKLHYLVDIESTQQGTLTKLYKYMVLSIGTDPSVASVAGCQL